MQAERESCSFEDSRILRLQAYFVPQSNCGGLFHRIFLNCPAESCNNCVQKFEQRFIGAEAEASMPATPESYRLHARTVPNVPPSD